MNTREAQIKLSKDIQDLVERFEKETGLLVSRDVVVHRAGITDSPSYYIYGIFLSTSVNSRWLKPE